MALLTLLSVINSALDQMDGFRVATIDDTIESQQIASIAEKVYNDLHADLSFSSDVTQNIIQLDSLADSTKPNYLKLPDDVIHTKDNKVMYNVTKDTGLDMREMDYITPQAFLDYVGNRPSTLPNSQIVTDFSGYQMVITNNAAPVLYTDFDDHHLVFDSFNSDVDSVLQSSKSGIIATIQGSFTQSGTYIIDFPEWFHPTYLNAVIAEASAALREEPIFHAARMARIGIIKAKKKQRIGIEDRRQRKYGR